MQKDEQVRQSCFSNSSARPRSSFMLHPSALTRLSRRKAHTSPLHIRRHRRTRRPALLARVKPKRRQPHRRSRRRRIRKLHLHRRLAGVPLKLPRRHIRRRHRPHIAENRRPAHPRRLAAGKKCRMMNAECRTKSNANVERSTSNIERRSTERPRSATLHFDVRIVFSSFCTHHSALTFPAVGVALIKVLKLLQNATRLASRDGIKFAPMRNPFAFSHRVRTPFAK